MDNSRRSTTKPFWSECSRRNAGQDENNPYFDSYEKINKVSRDIFNADVTTSYQLTDWLKATLRTGVDFYKEIGEVKLSKGSVLFTGGVPVPGNGGVWNGRLFGSYNIGQNTGNSINSDFYSAETGKLQKILMLNIWREEQSSLEGIII